MNITFDYNPYTVTTSVFINGKLISKDNMLYSIRKYVLQGWLKPSGSWVGLGPMLSRLSRGENMEICFLGRHCDYCDFEAVLSDYSFGQEVKISYTKAYENETVLNQIQKCIKLLWNEGADKIKVKSSSLKAKECVEVIDKDTIKDSWSMLNQNNSICIFAIENILEERYLNIIAQALQGNNFYHIPENTVFAVDKAWGMTKEDIQLILQDKGISDVNIILTDRKWLNRKLLSIIGGAEKTQIEDILQYLFMKYIQPRIIYEDYHNIFILTEPIMKDIENAKSIEEEYKACLQKINHLQTTTYDSGAESQLQDMVQIYNKLLFKRNRLKDTAFMNKINEVSKILNQSFGDKE